MISFLFGLAIPEAPKIDWLNEDPDSDWHKFVRNDMVNNYWRFMFGFPLIITVI